MPDPHSPPGAPTSFPDGALDGPPGPAPPPDGVRIAWALGRLVPPGHAGDADPDGPWPGLREAVVELVELTAATQVLGIHARLSAGVGIGGLPGSRERAGDAAAAFVGRTAAVLRAAGARPADWRPTALRAAGQAVAAGSLAGGRRVERLPRLVAQEIAGALAHQGRAAEDVVPQVACSLGYALGLFVLVEDPCEARVPGPLPAARV
jgi:hypothetical protein